VAVGLAVAVGHVAVLHVLTVDCSLGLVDKIRIAPVLRGDQTWTEEELLVSLRRLFESLNLLARAVRYQNSRGLLSWPGYGS